MLSDRQVTRVFGLLESTGIIADLEQTEEMSFDWHADVIARVMGQKLFTKTIDSVRDSFKRERPLGDTKQNHKS
jgi:hypothetical protein